MAKRIDPSVQFNMKAEEEAGQEKQEAAAAGQQQNHIRIESHDNSTNVAADMNANGEAVPTANDNLNPSPGRDIGSASVENSSTTENNGLGPSNYLGLGPGPVSPSFVDDGRDELTRMYSQGAALHDIDEFMFVNNRAPSIRLGAALAAAFNNESPERESQEGRLDLDSYLYNGFKLLCSYANDPEKAAGLVSKIRKEEEEEEAAKGAAEDKEEEGKEEGKKDSNKDDDNGAGGRQENE